MKTPLNVGDIVLNCGWDTVKGMEKFIENKFCKSIYNNILKISNVL